MNILVVEFVNNFLKRNFKMKKMIKLKILLLTVMMLLTTDLMAEPCPFIIKAGVEFWLCPDGTYTKKYTCKTIEWDEVINGVTVHKSTIVAIFYCCSWDETTKTLNTTIESISFVGNSSNRPPFWSLLEGVISELLKDTKIHCYSGYPACDDPNVPKKYEHKITFPSCWYYQNHQPFVGDDFILSLRKCEGSNCLSTYEVCTDYSQIPYKIVSNLVSKIIIGVPCTTEEPELPPESSPVWQQTWTTECFLLNNCN
jgi:hypothetical protein